MTKAINVLIVEDHQSIIDGYLYRLQGAQDIEVAATTFYGEEIESLLEEHSIDILILDVHIPTSPSNKSQFPVLFFLPQYLEKYPDLHILIISMSNKRSFIEFAMEAGVSGYILKEDQQAIETLPEILWSVVNGGVYFSDNLLAPLLESKEDENPLTSRQLQALSLCVAYPNETTAELAQRMDIKHSTIRNLLSQSYLRLGVRNRNAAIVKAQRRGII